MPASSTKGEFFPQVLNSIKERARSDSWLTVLQTGFSSLSDDLLPTYLALRVYLKQQSQENLCGALEEFEPQLAKLVSALPNPSLPSTLRKARELFLKTEHPEINGVVDTDIGAYFQARFDKSLDTARSIYQRLSVKYPEAESRATLLRWHRTSNPLFAPLFVRLTEDLADRSLESIRRTIVYILRCFGSGPRGKNWSLLEPIRTALRALPASKARAAQVLDRLRAYSREAEWHTQEFASVCDVLQDYLGDHLFERKEIRLVLPKSFSDQTQRQTKAKIVTIDVASVTFTEHDLKEILINPKIQGLENIALTYCWQYWLKTGDAGFESKVSVYSARHHSPHASIYQVIKDGQSRGVADEEILYAIYAIVARDSPYEYNVRKDIYMQSVWRRIKPGEQARPVIEDTRAWAEQLIKKEKKERKERRKRASLLVERQRQEKQELRKAAAQAVQQKKQEDAQARTRAEAKVTLMREEDKKRRERARQALSAPALTSAWTKYDGTELEVTSLKERIDALQNGREKNLHVMFRSRLEETIQQYLKDFALERGLDVKNVQNTLAVLAIKDFLLANYEAKTRSWMLSNERLKVRDLGLEVNDVEPIVENCLARLAEPVTV